MLELLTPIPAQQSRLLTPISQTTSVEPEFPTSLAVRQISAKDCISAPESTDVEFPADITPPEVQSNSAKSAQATACLEPSPPTKSTLLSPIAQTETIATRNREQPISDSTSTEFSERRQVVEERLAEIVAKDRQQQATKSIDRPDWSTRTSKSDRRIATAMQYASRGQYELARRLLRDPNLSTNARTLALSQINSLEAKSSQAPAPTATLSPQRRSPTAANPPSFVLSQPEAAPDPNPGLAQVAPDLSYPLPELPPPVLPAPTVAILPQTPAGQGIEFRFPLPSPAPITSPYGWRTHPILGDRRLHKGTDIGAPSGTPVLAAFAGKITAAKQMNGYGMAIVLESETGMQNSLYAHLSESYVRPGQWVQPGETIGRVGSTGLSTGPHLHFELRYRTAKGWQHFDPGPHLRWAMAQLRRRNELPT